MRSFFIVYDRISPYFIVLHGSALRSYVSVPYTEIYGRNTEPGIWSYFTVYGRLRPCLFDLGIYLHLFQFNSVFLIFRLQYFDIFSLTIL